MKHLSSQKGIAPIILVLIVLAVIFVGAGVYMLGAKKFQNSMVNKKLFNYEMVYTKDKKMYMYDLAGDTSKEIGSEYAALRNDMAAGWSKNGIFAFGNQDTKSLFLIEPPYQNSRKLLTDFTGRFFWKSDGSGIYFAKSFKNGEQISYVNSSAIPPEKTYFITLDGRQKEISLEDFNAEVEDYRSGSVTTREDPASFDNVYRAKSIFLNNKDTKTTLIANESSKNYPLPDGSYRPVISPDNTYLGYKEIIDFAKSSPLKVFFLKDVLAGKFDKPVITKDGAYEWEWINDEDILYVTHKVNPGGDLTYTYSFNTLNVKTKEIATVIQPFTTDQAYMELHVSPDGKYFLYNLFHQSGKTSKTYQNEFIVADSKTGKELRRFSTDPFTFSWSNPIALK